MPLVVDPVIIASSGARLLRDDAVAALVGRLFPLATVVTPNYLEAEALVGAGTRREMAERLHELGAPAAIVTGGHGEEPVDHLFDGRTHVEIPVAGTSRARPTARAARTPRRSRHCWPGGSRSRRRPAARRRSRLAPSRRACRRSAPVKDRSMSSDIAR